MRAAALALLAAALLAVLWSLRGRPPTVSRSPPLASARKPAKVPAPKPVRPEAPPPMPERPAAATPDPARPPAPPAPPPPAPGAAAGASGAELHEELIPRGVAIARCYYSQEVAAPGTTLGIDLDGSGFNSEFEKGIRLDPGGKDLLVKNLRLVTANQIHGEIEVGLSAATAFVYPKVLIRDLPVFVAPKPFGVVRRGEVLGIELTEVAEDGRSSRFRVVTNIDGDIFKQFWVEPTRPGLKVSSLEPDLPFGVEGRLQVADASLGEHGLAISIFSRRVYRREDIRIVAPNLGRTGRVSRITAVDAYRRPGDRLALDLEGTGLTGGAARLLGGHVEGHDMGKPTFDYVSPRSIRVSFAVPPAAPEKSYGVVITGLDEKTLLEEPNVFTIVPPLWVRAIEAQPRLIAGERSALQVTGRDLSPDFAKDLRIETEEPGIRILDVRFVDASTLAAEIAAEASVAPGDYLLHLRVKDRAIQPQSGSLVKVYSR